MKIYTVHIMPGVAPSDQKPEFVREGFNFPGFLFTVFWALYHRLWGRAFLIVAFQICLGSLLKAHVIMPAAVLILQIAMQFLIGFQGNDWIRKRLARRGYILADISTGDSLLRAEQRYFERYLQAAR